MEHTANPYLEFRKEFLKPLRKRETRFNDWLAVKITNIVGTMWCAYTFAALALVSLPAAIRGGTATLVAWIAQTFLRPHVVSFLDTATTHLGIDLEIGEIVVGRESKFAGKTIESSRIRQDRGVIILAIKRADGMHFNPAPDDRIESSDCLIAMGEPSQLRQLEQLAAAKA